MTNDATDKKKKEENEEAVFSVFSELLGKAELRLLIVTALQEKRTFANQIAWIIDQHFKQKIDQLDPVVVDSLNFF